MREGKPADVCADLSGLLLSATLELMILGDKEVWLMRERDRLLSVSKPGPRKQFNDWKDELGKRLLDVYDKNNEKIPLKFDTVISDSETALKTEEYRYTAQGTLFHDTFIDVKNKTKTYTDNIESEGAAYFESQKLTPANHGLYHRDHRFQVFARHSPTEPNLREHDGFFFSKEQKLAFVLSAKSRFMKNDVRELFDDVDDIPEFHPADWLFQINRKGDVAPLTSLPEYSWMKSKDSFTLYGLGFSPNCHHLAPFCYPKRNPRVFLFDRRILHQPLSLLNTFLPLLQRALNFKK
ncbi:hypothetical protein BC830DRAFT_1215582 [Chytriomyces sp. MP71]|nr:hypothetical protein BC830DRAFT_1215582 [Chytriomyces sp. MP71]